MVVPLTRAQASRAIPVPMQILLIAFLMAPIVLDGITPAIYARGVYKQVIPVSACPAEHVLRLWTTAADGDRQMMRSSHIVNDHSELQIG